MTAKFDPYTEWLGIEDVRRPVNAYALLGLELYDSEPERIQQAAGRCMLKLKPHAKGPRAAEAQALAVEVTSAKLILLNPDQKGPYDAMLRKRAAERTRKIRNRVIAFTSAVIGVVLISLGIWTIMKFFRATGTPLADRATPATSAPLTTIESAANEAHETNAATTQSQVEPELSTTENRAEPTQVTTDAQEVPAVIELAEPAVVRIEVKSKDGESIGSGFLADNAGTIVTNFHVVDQAESVTVIWHDGSRHPGRGFVAADPARDLAAIRVLGTVKASPLALAGAAPQKGEKVLALGSPRGFSFSVSEGIVSGVRRGTEVAQVLRKASGHDIYRDRGFDPQATWVQSTAAISGGNSGGPLLNMKGELVAVNTWTHELGQSLNFAISVDDVRMLLEKIAKDPQPFANLPASNGRSHRAREGNEPGGTNTVGTSPPKNFRVELPSGRLFTNESTVLPASQIRQAFPEKMPKLTLNDANGNIAGVFTHDDGRLDGAAASFHPNGRCWVFATYKDSKREGLFRAWDDKGHRILWAEFRFDRRDGAVCLFRKDAPWLIQEYDKGKLTHSHLVAYLEDGGAQLMSFSDTDQAINEEQQLSEAIQELTRLEEEMTEGEQRIRRTLSEWYRDERKRAYRENRKETAGMRSAQRGAEDAASARAAQGAVNELIRRATGR